MFVGRKEELKILEEEYVSDKFAMTLIYGRRRVGKTTLIKQFINDKKGIYFVAEQMGDKYNLVSFSKVVTKYFENVEYEFTSWDDIFGYIYEKTKKDKVVISIDEFSFLTDTNKSLMSKLQNHIDNKFTNTKLKLILSSSYISFMENEIMGYSSPLFGRRTAQIKVEAFNYIDSSKFYKKFSNKEKVEAYCVFGGIPHYISKIDDRVSLKENIINLLLKNGSYLKEEPELLLKQELRQPNEYSKILYVIANGATKLNEIYNKGNIDTSSKCAIYLKTLINLGIVSKEYIYGERNNNKKAFYTLSDNLFAFYYRYILPYASTLEMLDKQVFYKKIIEPSFSTYIGVKFEKVCREFLINKNKEGKLDIICYEIANYIYDDKKNKSQLEIDIMAGNDKDIMAYECKWTTKKIDNKIIKGLEEKTSHLNNIYKLGFFSLSGYEKNIDKNRYNLYVLDDLFKL